MLCFGLVLVLVLALARFYTCKKLDEKTVRIEFLESREKELDQQIVDQAEIYTKTLSEKDGVITILRVDNEDLKE